MSSTQQSDLPLHAGNPPTATPQVSPPHAISSSVTTPSLAARIMARPHGQFATAGAGYGTAHSIAGTHVQPHHVHSVSQPFSTQPQPHSLQDNAAAGHWMLLAAQQQRTGPRGTNILHCMLPGLSASKSAPPQQLHTHRTHMHRMGKLTAIHTHTQHHTPPHSATPPLLRLTLCAWSHTHRVGALITRVKGLTPSPRSISRPMMRW
eukprot:GHVR01062859.1.p1 GENE.GHVR01062859.1~~GHVR01062859.1.p1  ORF type:complete len:206 (-),score=29.74 GHVR01062859.1:240-857(-)